MNLNKTLKAVFVASMVWTLAVVLVYAHRGCGECGPYPDSLWQSIIISDDEYVAALLTHDIDVGGVPRPEDLPAITAEGYTITTMRRIGQTFLFENNRVWPLGVPYRYTTECDLTSGYPDPDWCASEPPDYCCRGIPHEWRAEYFRKALHRLINKTAIDALYAPLMGTAKYWLPPGQTAWIKTDPETGDMLELPGYDPMLAVDLLNAAGFVQGTKDNPDHKPGVPWSSPKVRIDPISGKHLDEMTYTYYPACADPITTTGIEYYAIGPTESPIGFEMAIMINDWWNTAGIPTHLVAGTWLGMVSKLVDPVLENHQIMTGVGIVWGSTAPDILFDFVHSLNLPLWNFAGMKYNCTYDEVSCDPPPIVGGPYDRPWDYETNRDSDYWGEMMFKTLDPGMGTDEEPGAKRCAYEIQEVLATHEPYVPLLEWNMFGAFTGPCPEIPPGYIGIVNAMGFGATSTYEIFSKDLGRCNRTDPSTGNEIVKRGWGSYLDTLNPYLADTVADWTVLHMVDGPGFIELNPYNHKYMPWVTEPGENLEYMKWDDNVGYTPVTKKWIGPGRTHADYDGVYNADVTYEYDPDTGQDELATYDGIAVDDVKEADLKGDDQLGARTLWKLREGIYWQDSDPGKDCEYGTADDGDVYPLTTADLTFTMDVLIKQENERYFSAWWFVYEYEAKDAYVFEVYEERRYAFAFEGHGVALLPAPKHIWEPYIAGPDEILWTEDDNHHQYWTGWEEYYKPGGMRDPQYRDPATGEVAADAPTLSKLIGIGSYVYHLDAWGWGPGWKPGEYTHIEASTLFNSKIRLGVGIKPGICKDLVGDVDLNQIVDLADLYEVLASLGTYKMPNYDPKADICYPAQIVDLDEIRVVSDQYGLTWGPWIPYATSG